MTSSASLASRLLLETMGGGVVMLEPIPVTPLGESPAAHEHGDWYLAQGYGSALKARWHLPTQLLTFVKARNLRTELLPPWIISSVRLPPA